MGVDAACDNGDIATDQCSDGNSACSSDGVGYKCLCTSDYFDLSGTCTSSKLNALLLLFFSFLACSSDGGGGDTCLCTSACYESSSTCHDSKLDFSILSILSIR